MGRSARQKRKKRKDPLPVGSAAPLSPRQAEREERLQSFAAERALAGTTLTVWTEPRSGTDRSDRVRELIEGSETYFRTEMDALAASDDKDHAAELALMTGAAHPDPLAELSSAEIMNECDESFRDANRAQRSVFRNILAAGRRRIYINDADSLVRWVSQRYSITHYKARRWIRTAYQLPFLPHIDRAYQDGQLSLDKLLELVRMATPHNERDLLTWSVSVSVTAVRERADEMTRIDVKDVRRADRFRCFRWRYDPEDPTRINFFGSLPAADALVVINALERIATELPDSPEDLVDPDEPELLIDAKRADALVALASQELAEDADADRATVVMHVPRAVVAGADANSVIDGHPIAPQISERMACDARLQMIVEDDSGGIVGIGETSRNIPRWLRRAVEFRDGFRCTFPGCGTKRFTDCHHILKWPLGPTEIWNLVLLCRHHHKLVHEWGWHVQLRQDGTTAWFRPDWEPYQPGPPPSDRTEAAPQSQPTRSQPSQSQTSTDDLFEEALEAICQLDGEF